QVLRGYQTYPLNAFNHIFATRGCPYTCFFCASHKIWSRKVRFRSPCNVVAEINSIRAKGLSSVVFEDDTFGVNKEYLNALCGEIRKGSPGVKWACEIHVNLVNDETIQLMKQAGCYAIKLGIESGNNDILKRIRKNITIENALKACRIIKKHGIELHVFYMIGFPEETEETLLDTINAIKSTKCDRVIYSIFTPYPGTEAFDICKAKGLIKDDFDVSLYYHQSPANYFCPNIPRERFRELASAAEKMIDRKNRMNRIRRLFSVNTLWRIKELGLGKSLRKAIRVLGGK
ncbi:MAG: radical SAM protein, partial [Candidatus Omnitrophica bacterium]|nr:radical SAM protein [Candidatus Omnitrophota bacterium]